MDVNWKGSSVVQFVYRDVTIFAKYKFFSFTTTFNFSKI